MYLHGNRMSQSPDGSTGLVFASPSVVFVCNQTEKCLQGILKTTGNKPPQADRLVQSITMSVMQSCSGKQLFSCLDAHMFDTTPTTNHTLSLIKCCIECFLKIRLHHIGKQYTEQITGDKIRKQFSKLVLFKHQ